MKILKIMLLSYALLASVGGALAFKAKLGSEEYCTTITNGDNSPNFCSNDEDTQRLTCPNLAPRFVEAGGTPYCYTLDEDGTIDCLDFGSAILTCEQIHDEFKKG